MYFEVFKVMDSLSEACVGVTSHTCSMRHLHVGSAIKTLWQNSEISIGYTTSTRSISRLYSE